MGSKTRRDAWCFFLIFFHTGSKFDRLLNQKPHLRPGWWTLIMILLWSYQMMILSKFPLPKLKHFSVTLDSQVTWIYSRCNGLWMTKLRQKSGQSYHLNPKGWREENPEIGFAILFLWWSLREARDWERLGETFITFQRLINVPSRALLQAYELSSPCLIWIHHSSHHQTHKCPPTQLK